MTQVTPNTQSLWPCIILKASLAQWLDTAFDTAFDTESNVKAINSAVNHTSHTTGTDKLSRCEHLQAQEQPAGGQAQNGAVIWAAAAGSQQVAARIALQAPDAASHLQHIQFRLWNYTSRIPFSRWGRSRRQPAGRRTHCAPSS